MLEPRAARARVTRPRQSDRGDSQSGGPSLEMNPLRPSIRTQGHEGVQGPVTRPPVGAGTQVEPSQFDEEKHRIGCTCYGCVVQ